MYKMVNAGVLEKINGCISTGKESVVFHADGGRWAEPELAIDALLFQENFIRKDSVH